MNLIKQKVLTVEQAEILRAVLYFDLFRYPLTRFELFENSAIRVPLSEFERALDDLLSSGLLMQIDHFILCPDRGRDEINRRVEGNRGADEIMPTALRYSKIIASFPFVEGVLLSGALSKNYYDSFGDIDFFIVTKPNRLWICRTLLIIRYKLLAREKKKFWCTNYFISSSDTRIEDINIFTGTELAYLIPTVNYSIYRNIVENNVWYKSRFPNKPEASSHTCIDTPNPILKLVFEKLLGGSIGNWIDNRLLSYTLNRWRKKYETMSDEDFDLQFRSRKNVAKRHTKGFQNKILKSWEERQREFEAIHHIRL